MKQYMFYSQNSGKHTLFLLLFWIQIVIVCFSSFILYSSVISFVISALCLAYIAYARMGRSKEYKTFLTASFLIVAIILLYGIIGHSSIGALEIVVNLNWIIIGVIAIYVKKFFSGRELTLTYKVMVISLFILMLLFVRNGRSFLVAGNADEAVSVAVAWYGSLFMLISGISLIIVLNVKNTLLRIVAFVVLLLTLYLNIFILQRGTNVIFTLAEISLILIFLIKRKSIVFLFSFLIFAFVIIVMSSDNLINLFDWLAQVSPSERLAKRFDEISIALTYENMEAGGGSFAARGSLIGVSWNTFTSSIGHFVFGAGEHTGNNDIIGHHSFFVDTLARYGIIGGVLVFIYFKKQYQILMSILNKNKEWALYMQCAIVFLFYVMRNFYGQVAYALVNLVILLLFPLTIELILFYNNKIKI